MSYGMSYYDYWHGDVRAHRMYKEAHKLKISEQNTMNWLMGQYVYEAIGDWAGIIRAFSKQSKPGKFTDHPYELFPEDTKAREDREARERYDRIKAKVTAFAEAFNAENAKKKAGQSPNENTPIGKEVKDNA